MAFGTVSFVLLLVAASTIAQEESFDTTYNDNCPDLSAALGQGCDVTASDCTEITCRDQSLGENSLTLTIKLNKCDDPPTVDITVKALMVSWSHTFTTDDRIAVPGLSVKAPGNLGSGGVYLKVQLEDTGSNLKLKIYLLSGFEVLGKFEKITELKIAESDLPISTWECGIVRWWKGLSTILQVLVVCGGLVVLGTLGTCCCCCCCTCCRNKSRGGNIVVVPPGAATITSTNTNVPMKPFVNEI